MARIDQATEDLETVARSVNGADMPSPNTDRFSQTFWMAYAAWLAIIQINSPLKTEEIFLRLSAAALCIFVLVYKILPYTKNLTNPQNIEMYLSSFAWMCGAVAHLSLLTIIFISRDLMWIRYLIISGFCVVKVAYTYANDIIWLVKKMGDDIWKGTKEFTENNTSPAAISPV